MAQLGHATAQSGDLTVYGWVVYTSPTSMAVPHVEVRLEEVAL